MTYVEIKRFFRNHKYPKELVIDDEKKLLIYYNNNNVESLQDLGVYIYLVNKDTVRPRFRKYVNCEKMIHIFHDSSHPWYTINHHKELFPYGRLY